MEVQVEDFVTVASDGGAPNGISFTIPGEPIAQNGWKVRFRGLPFPVIFDPHSKAKKTLRKAIKQAMQEFDAPQFPHRNMLNVRVRFFLKRRYPKDLDNMSKFLLDALEGAVYPNDDAIVLLIVSKKFSNSAKTEIEITSL